MQNLQLEIPSELLLPAESLPFSGVFVLPEITQGSNTYTFASPLTWDIRITNTGNALLVEGIVGGCATVECVRCLDVAQFDIEGQAEGYFLMPGAEGPDEEQEEYEVLREDNCIDLEPIFMSALALALPFAPVCSANCKGLCAGCGANLNKEACTCSATEEDAFDQSPFAVLRTLTFDTDDE